MGCVIHLGVSVVLATATGADRCGDSIRLAFFAALMALSGLRGAHTNVGFASRQNAG
jgi:hypothetical protein